MNRKSKNQKAYRDRNFDKGCCTLCGRKMAEDDLRAACVRCRRYHNISNLYRRHFLKDFT